jgi:hypothetical protein
VEPAQCIVAISCFVVRPSPIATMMVVPVIVMGVMVAVVVPVAVVPMMMVPIIRVVRLLYEAVINAGVAYRHCGSLCGEGADAERYRARQACDQCVA